MALVGTGVWYGSPNTKSNGSGKSRPSRLRLKTYVWFCMMTAMNCQKDFTAPIKSTALMAVYGTHAHAFEEPINTVDVLLHQRGNRSKYPESAMSTLVDSMTSLVPIGNTSIQIAARVPSYRQLEQIQRR